MKKRGKEATKGRRMRNEGGRDKGARVEKRGKEITKGREDGKYRRKREWK